MLKSIMEYSNIKENIMKFIDKIIMEFIDEIINS